MSIHIHSQSSAAIAILLPMMLRMPTVRTKAEPMAVWLNNNNAL